MTNLNGSSVASGTVADARIASTLARDSEVESASNIVHVAIIATNDLLVSAYSAADTVVSNALSARLIATNDLLVTVVQQYNSRP